jgi:hypothetical protein
VGNDVYTAANVVGAGANYVSVEGSANDVGKLLSERNGEHGSGHFISILEAGAELVGIQIARHGGTIRRLTPCDQLCRRARSVSSTLLGHVNLSTTQIYVSLQPTTSERLATREIEFLDFRSWARCISAP